MFLLALLTWRNLLGLLVVLNAKTLPLAFHVRLYYYIIRNLRARGRRPPASIFEPTRITTVTTMLEMDFNMHKSNSTYFTDMDISRANLMTRTFCKFYNEFSDPDLPKLKRHQFIYTPLGSVGVVFKREIVAYVPYVVESRVIGWTEKWIFVLSVFKRGSTVYAYGLSKYVLKQQRKTIRPETIIAFEGLLTDEAKEQNKKVQPYLTKSLDLEEIINLVT